MDDIFRGSGGLKSRRNLKGAGLMLAVVAGLALAIVVFLTSHKGAQTVEFLSEARFELRKVVWPSREEATRTTWVVAAVVILIALMLALFDFFIQGGVKWLLSA